jgi:hypothetical protein
MGKSNKSQFDYLLLVGTCLTVWSPIPPVVVKFFCPLTNAHHPLRQDLMNRILCVLQLHPDTADYVFHLTNGQPGAVHGVIGMIKKDLPYRRL